MLHTDVRHFRSGRFRRGAGLSSSRSPWADNQSQRSVKEGLLTKVAKPSVPCAIRKVSRQSCHKPLYRRLRNETPSRAGTTGVFVEQSFGTAIIGFIETISAIEWYRNMYRLRRGERR